MEYLLNEELIPMVNIGMLDMEKINSLIEIREFINRVSGTKYLEDHIVNKIEQEHNSRPSVVSWGDYFQTELAFDLQGQKDEDFIRAVDTVKYDIISSYEIFSGKNDFFFEWVEHNLSEKEIKKDVFTKEEYEEALHLNILKDYYTNLKIEDKFTKEERLWYETFKEAKAV